MSLEKSSRRFRYEAGVFMKKTFGTVLLHQGYKLFAGQRFLL